MKRIELAAADYLKLRDFLSSVNGHQKRCGRLIKHQLRSLGEGSETWGGDLYFVSSWGNRC